MSTPSRASRAWLAVALALLVLGAGIAYQMSRTERSPARVVSSWLWRINYWAFPVEDRGELSALHADTSRGSRARCIACHEDKVNSKLVLHRIHLRSDLLSSLECHDCHQSVDLTKRGNKAVVSWVDVGFCKKCHAEFPGLKPGSAMKPDYFERDCTQCHTGPKAPKHAQPYLPTAVLSAQDCRGCHGGRVLPSTARHERDDWLKTHGAEALDQGADQCYQCHDFGLKFCEACHEEKPPSHLPAERWRAVHSRVARADTRVCYSCHKVSFCKRCHLNHEAGWMQNHPAFVEEKGDESCSECHSESSCSYCHMLTSTSDESTAAP